MNTAWQEIDTQPDESHVFLRERDWQTIIALLKARAEKCNVPACEEIATEIYRQLYGGPDYNKAKGVLPFDGELPENTLERR